MLHIDKLVKHNYSHAWRVEGNYLDLYAIHVSCGMIVLPYMLTSAVNC